MVERALAGLRSPLSATVDTPIAAPRRDDWNGHRLVAIIAASTLARLLLAASIGLGVDESYAVAVARPLSLSYYDHPPLVFWITAAVEWLGGATSNVLLRLPFIALYAATTWLIARLTAQRFGARAATYAALLMQLIPVFSVADGGWILPDGPLLFGCAAFALALSNAVTAIDDAAQRRAWLLAGVALGVALLSKYHALLCAASALGFLLTTPRLRPWLSRPEPYVGALLACVIALPVVVWNASHGWASFRFQGARADVAHGLHLESLFQNLAGQAAYVLPWIWIPLVWLLIRALRKGPADEARWMLALLAAGPIVVFTGLSLGGRPGLPHWPAPGFLFLIPLLADALAGSAERGRQRVVHAYVGGSLVFVVALLVVAVTQIRTGFVSRAFPGLFARGDPSLDAIDWRELRPAVASLSAERPAAVVTGNWIDAAKIGAALAPDGAVQCLSDDPRHFQFLKRSPSGAALVILREDAPRDSSELFRRVRERYASLSADPAIRVAIRRHGDPAIRLLIFRAGR